MGGSRKRSDGRRFTDAERFLAYQRILERWSYVELAGELNCSLKFLYRQFGTQKERVRRNPVRSTLHLSAAEREEISRGLKEGASYRAIASRGGRAPSTISHEVKANGGRTKYRAWCADERAMRRSARPREPKLARDAGLRAEVELLLSDLWSPRQISAYLRRAYLDDEGGAQSAPLDDLPSALRAGPRQPPQGAHRVPEVGSREPQVARPYGDAGQDPRHGRDQRTPRGD